MSKFVTLSFWTKTGEGRNVVGIKVADPGAPDLDSFNAQLSGIFEKLDANGYDAIHVVPLQIAGPATTDKKHYAAITRGAAVVGRRRE